jgi:hypothetical protein
MHNDISLKMGPKSKYEIHFSFICTLFTWSKGDFIEWFQCTCDLTMTHHHMRLRVEASLVISFKTFEFGDFSIWIFGGILNLCFPLTAETLFLIKYFVTQWYST